MERARLSVAEDRWAAGMVRVRSSRLLQSESHAQELIAGLSASIAAAGGSFIVKVARDELDEMTTYEHWARNTDIRSVVIEDVLVDDPRPARLAALGLQVTILGEFEVAGQRPVVWDDHVQPMRLAITTLRDLGHRNVAHVSGPTQYRHTIARSVAFQSAVRENSMVGLEHVGDYSFDSGADVARGLLQRDDAPTAIIFDNDLMALGALQALQADGLRIPTDASLIAWDDSVRCQIAKPSLAALRRNVRLSGMLAGEALVAARRGTVLQTMGPMRQLLLRDTVAPPPQSER